LDLSWSKGAISNIVISSFNVISQDKPIDHEQWSEHLLYLNCRGETAVFRLREEHFGYVCHPTVMATGNGHRQRFPIYNGLQTNNRVL